MEWNRAKRKRKLIEIQFEPGDPTLKVTKIAGKYMESMGIPGKNGYSLYPEEAVYLLETGSAMISTSSGRELSLLEAFSILEQNGVSMSKYEIYKQIKLLGLVVLRPRKSIIDYENLRKIGNSIKQKFDEKRFENLVEMTTNREEGVPNPNSFPSFRKNSNNDFLMELKVLHTDSSLVNFLPPDVILGFPTEKTLRNLPPPNPNRQSCRPIYWPIMKSHVDNWSQFRFEMENKRQEAIMKRFKKLRPPSQQEIRRERITVENLDFHVFSPAAFSHRLPARPLFSLICHRSSGPKFNILELSELRNVVLAVEEMGKIGYVSISGAPIDLNSFLC